MVEKGLSALESLLFAKYQMYRNVYWHHAVRSATAMYKRLVADALDTGALDARDARRASPMKVCCTTSHSARRVPLLAGCASAGCYKRAFECPAADLAAGCRRVDRRRSRTHCRGGERTRRASSGSQPGDLLLDYPEKTQMLGLDLLVQRRDGEVRRLTATGWEGAINLPKLSEEFYRSARWLRIYTSSRIAIDPDSVLRLASKSAAEVRSRLKAGESLINW